MVTIISHQSQTTFILFTFSSLSKPPPNIHSAFIFTSSFCLFPSSFCSTVTPTSCYHLRFVLLSSQDYVSCCRSRFIVSFLSIFSFIFFSHLSSSPRFHSQGMKNFQYTHFGPIRTELYSKHWSMPCRRLVGKAKKRKEKKRHRSDTLTFVLRKHSSSSTSSRHRALF